MRIINEFDTTMAMAVDVKAKAMSGRVYNLAAGDPNLDICDGLRIAYRFMNVNETHNYGSSQGLPELRKLVWNNPDEVIVSNGAKTLISLSLQTVTKPGSHVVLVGPCWSSYIKVCEILKLDFDLICGKEENRYIPDIEEIRTRVNADTSAIIINNPNNPTGVIYDDEYMESLYRIAEENDCWIIDDEIYGGIAERKPLSFKGRERAIVIDGFSKSLNLTGWRIGYAIAPENVIRMMSNLQSQLSGPTSTYMQKLLVSAWNDLRFEDFESYRDRIDLLCSIEKFKRFRPEGGFYFYLPIDEKWKDSMELCNYMLDRYSIALTPGDDYGVERTVRISVAYISLDDLKEIVGYLGEI